MKKFISILLLGLMFYNILGYYFAYRMMIYENKEEMNEIINNLKKDDNIVLLKFHYSNGKVDEKDFRFTDDDEFLYQGKLFDISISEIHGDYIYFYCINDTNEQDINQQLNKHITDNLTDTPAIPKKSNDNIKKSFINEYLPHKSLVLMVPPISKTILFFPQEKDFTLKLDVETPPPKFYSGI